MRSVSFQLNLTSTSLPLRQSIKTDMGKLFDNSNLLARTKRSQLVHIAWLIDQNLDLSPMAHTLVCGVQCSQRYRRTQGRST